MNRAYSLLEIKSVDVAQRIVEGIASTPSVDRGGDSMDPAGAQFRLPLPFLWDHKLPIGEVFAADVRPDGIHIKARVSTVETPGSVRDRVEEAWQSFTAQPPLVRGLSIGWQELEGAPIKGTKFRRVLKWIWGELSAVVVPMNVEATITAVKSFDQAATGPHAPGVTGSVVHAVKAAKLMTIPEQITQFENTRAAKAAARDALMATAAETGETLDQVQSEQYDGLDLEVKNVDAHLVRLRALEQSNIQKATPITATAVQPAGDQRGGIIQVKSMAPKGSGFTRYAMLVLATKGNMMQAELMAKERYPDMPEVALMCKAAVAAGTTTGATWALPLVPAAQQLQGEFLELLRPKTLLGRMTGLRKVPFNVSVPSQTAGGTYGWVGEGKPKPVTSLAFATVTLGFAKIAGIIVLTEELVRMSSPSAEETVRTDMIAGVAQFMDQQFLDETVAAVANVSPASITNGIAPVVTAGSTADNAKTDIKALVSAFVVANLSLENAILITSEANAFALGVAVNPLGQPMFPGFGASGGTIMGIPVITSQAAGSRIILVDQRGILYADEGSTTIDMSREASLQMDGAPDSPATATTVYQSLWQLNMVGLRVERHCTWLRARTASVKWTSGAAYV